jgi:uncharacterized membrane protein YphA (DoxX/SURF4 family)
MSSLEGKQFRMGATAKRLLLLGLVPQSPDLALLVLRVLIGTSLFLRHGMEKLSGNSEMIKHFPDPLHVGTYAASPCRLSPMVSARFLSYLALLHAGQH